MKVRALEDFFIFCRDEIMKKLSFLLFAISCICASTLAPATIRAQTVGLRTSAHKAPNYTPIAKSKPANSSDCTPLSPCDGTDHCCMVGTDNGFCCPEDTDCDLDNLTCVPQDESKKPRVKK